MHSGSTSPGDEGAMRDEEIDELSSTRIIVNQAQRNQQSQAWTHLSSKIFHFLRTRFGRVNLPPDTEFDDYGSEVMIRVLRDIQKFEDRGEGSFWGWVHRLAQNRLNDLWRHYESRQRLGVTMPGPNEEGQDLMDQMDDPDALSATAILRFRELERAEVDCAERLPTDMRKIYFMRRQHEMPFHDISAAIGKIKENTLRSVYKRARDYVQACIRSKLDDLGQKLPGWK